MTTLNNKRILLGGVAGVALLLNITNAKATIEEGDNNSIVVSGNETMSEIPSATTIYNDGNLTFNMIEDESIISADIVNNHDATIENITNNDKVVIYNGRLTNSGNIVNLFNLEGEVINNVGGTIDAARFAGNAINNGHINNASVESTVDNNGTMNDVSVSGTRHGVLNANLGSTIQTLYLANSAVVNAAVAERGNNDTAWLGDITIGTVIDDEIGDTEEAGTATLKLVIGNTVNDTVSVANNVTGGRLLLQENSLYDFSGDNIVDNGYLGGDIEITKKANNEISENTGANSNQAATIAAMIDGADTDNETFNEIAGGISEMLQSDDEAVKKAALDTLTVMAPDVAPIVQRNVIELNNQIFGAVGTRMSGGAVAAARQGVASGDSISDNAAVWMQGLFNKTELDDRDNVKGFDAKTYCAAFGLEKQINNKVKAGIGYAYSETDVDAYKRDIDVDTHSAFVYGEYKPSKWFVNAAAAYSWSDYSESKNVAGAGVKADWDVDVWALQTMTGYELMLNGYNVTPEAGLRYVHIKQDSYTDTAGQKISADDADVLTGVIGAKVAKTYALNNGMLLTPELRGALTYDLSQDDVAATVTLPNGSAYNVNGDALDEFGIELGAGVKAEINDRMELSVGYEGKFREDYQDHSGLLNMKYKF